MYLEVIMLIKNFDQVITIEEEEEELWALRVNKIFSKNKKFIILLNNPH